MPDRFDRRRLLLVTQSLAAGRPTEPRDLARQLVGEESGETYRAGQRLTLRLAEANPVSGSLRFELPEGSYGGPRQAPQRRDRVRGGNRRGRPANIHHDSRRR